MFSTKENKKIMKKYITFPLSEAAGEAVLIHMDSQFDRSIAGLLVSTIPVSLNPPRTSSVVPTQLAELFKYNGGIAAESTTTTFEMNIGSAIIQIHADLSATIGIERPGKEPDLVVTCPLRVSRDALDQKNRDTLTKEARLWIEAAFQVPPAIWAGDTPCPARLCAPWNDFDVGDAETQSHLHKFAAIVHVTAAALHPHIKREGLHVSIEGRKTLPDGTLSNPAVRILTNSAKSHEFDEIPSHKITEIACAALRNLPFQDMLIAQEWDRFGEDGQDYCIHASCLLFYEGSEASPLSAHEQISAREMLSEQAGQDLQL